MKQYAKYHIDRININSRMSLNQLHRILSQSELGNHCKDVSIGRASGTARQFHFKSKIEAIAPTKTFFEILGSTGFALHDTYKISRIEIAYDMATGDEFRTEMDVDALSEEIIKKYSHEHFVFDATGKPGKVVDGIYSRKTYYWGGKNFKLTVYARTSKVLTVPSVHMEWRITGAALIKKKTGVSTIQDLIDFDVEGCFEAQLHKYLTLGEIDHEKHGQWLVGMRRGMTTPPYGFSNAPKADPVMASLTTCYLYNIQTAAGLIKYYRDLKYKLKHERGRPTVGVRRILGLSDYMLKSFVKLR